MGIRPELHTTSIGDARYLCETETSLNRVGRNFEGSGSYSHPKLLVFSQVGRPLLGKQYEELNFTEWAQARMYILENCEETRIFIDMHKEKLKREDARNIEKRHAEEFHQWFKKHVCQLYDEGSELLRTQEPYVLASQAEQVYYVKDSNWQVVVKTKLRDLYDLACEDVGEEPCQENEELNFRFHKFNVGNGDDDDVVSLDRPQLGSTVIEENSVNLDATVGVEDEEDESDYDEFTSINDKDDESDSISDAKANDDDDDD
ncbi:hypothetical protein HRI_002453500 [Hibiscus trionum]|uniref:DUF4216 domain-containing protein n=1 Tax=Hibiscus trionum TaxID=183268 RepID=A0A9W7M327_HIBTR|nr:hypothetical protein HRI_002453500 [Hibiscus trionum]